MSLKDRYENKVLVICPSCGSEENNMMVARTSFTLKGEGWYKDGYKSKEEK